jgi:hypothetical protein
LEIITIIFLLLCQGKQVTKYGYLSKEGGFWKTIKKRWFVLSGSFLTYFDSAVPIESIDFDKALGMITIVGSNITSIKDSSSPHAFGIQPTGNDRMYKLIASSDNERQQWMDALIACGGIGEAVIAQRNKEVMEEGLSNPFALKEGWLLKQGKDLYSAFKPRYCILDRTKQFSYFINKPSYSQMQEEKYDIILKEVNFTDASVEILSPKLAKIAIRLIAEDSASNTPLPSWDHEKMAVFAVTCRSGRTYHFICESESECNSWISVFKTSNCNATDGLPTDSHRRSSSITTPCINSKVNLKSGYPEDKKSSLCASKTSNNLSSNNNSDLKVDPVSVESNQVVNNVADSVVSKLKKEIIIGKKLKKTQTSSCSSVTSKLKAELSNGVKLKKTEQKKDDLFNDMPDLTSWTTSNNTSHISTSDTSTHVQSNSDLNFDMDALNAAPPLSSSKISLSSTTSTSPASASSSFLEAEKLSMRVKSRIAELERQSQRDAAEAAEKEVKEDEIKEIVLMWVKMCKKSISKMLSTLDDVFPWAGPQQQLDANSSYNDIKKGYHRAIIVVHPDKQMNSSIEQQLLASEIFKMLNKAFSAVKEKLQNS